MSSPRSESDLVRLRRLARECAKERRERVSTIHLLAAVWRTGGPARELLDARRLDDAALLKGARAFDETIEDAVEETLAASRGVARRAAVPSRRAFTGTRGASPGLEPAPGAIHVLVVLASNRRLAAYRTLVQCGVDVAGLRAAATRVALGVVQPPRERKRDDAVDREAAGAGTLPARKPVRGDGRAEGPRAEAVRFDGRPVRTPRGRAVQVPLIPPLAPRLGAQVRRPGEAPPAGPPGDKGPPSEEGAGAEVAPKSTERPSERHTPETSEERAPATGTPGAPAEAPAATESALDPALHPVLCELGRDLSVLARAGELDPVIGRETEIDQVLDVIAKRHANAALIVGPAGVGKTSVARGLAHRLAATDRAVVEVGVGDLLAGTSARGSLAERIGALRAEVAASQGRVILFIDEIHELFGIDEVAAELKTALARGELPLVGATGFDGHQRVIEPDPALARRFTVVEVEEPNEADAFLVLRAVADDLGRHHGVTVSDEAVAASIAWSIRYLPGRALPDKAVGVLDLASARLCRRAEGDRLEPDHVAEVVAEMTEVPVERLLESDQERMLSLHRLLGARVIGHDDACHRIAAVLRRNAAGLRGARPIGSFLLLGPTGVGKTETAKAIAEALFHVPEAMTRLDMSEYAEPHAIARLLGAPPGYVGHEAGGVLTEAVRKRPYQVILLDEIEKAHRDVLQAFLQVFDEGRMTDGRGRTIDFKSTVIVMTSNLGAQELRAALTTRRVGFASSAPSSADLRDVALRAAKAQLPPELYNRIDEVVFYRPLDEADVRRVAVRMIDDLRARLAPRGVALEIEPAAIDALVTQGFEPDLGARPMRRAIARLVEAPLADMILAGELTMGSTVIVAADDGTISIDAVDPPLAAAGS